MAVLRHLLLMITALLCVTEYTQSAKILTLSIKHYSHMNVMLEAAKTLRDAGHEVHFMVADKLKSKAVKAVIKTHIYQHSAATDHDAAIEESVKDTLQGTTSILKTISMLSSAFKPMEQQCRETLGDEKLMKELEAEHFDFVIIDSSPLFRCYYAIPYRLGLRYISFGPVDEPVTAGVTALPSVQPDIALGSHGLMSFKERIANTIITYAAVYFSNQMITGDNIISEYVPNKPPTTLKSLFLGSEMWICTQDTFCFNYGKMFAPHFQYIGSLTGSKPAKPLSKELEEWVKGAEHGVVVIGFGSLKGALQGALPVIMKPLLEGCRLIKQRVILQYSSDLPPLKDLPANVLQVNWLPQSDLLAHPKTKVFVTHGGLNGALESTYNAVPTLTLPFQGEQYGNGVRATMKGYGLLLEYHTLTPAAFADAINELATNSSYKENLAKCAKILKSVPDPKKSLVFWVNHILEFGGSHLRPPYLEMPFSQILGLDVLAFFITIMLLVCGFVLFCCRLCYRKCCSAGSKRKRD